MRIEQMHYNFELGIDRVASNDRPDFMPWEIDEHLNNAIYKFLKDRYKINEQKEAFEVNQYRLSELSNLHIKSPELQPAIIPTSLGSGKYEVRLDNLGNNISGQYFRYLFLTKAEITIQKGLCTKKVRLKLYQSDDDKTFYDQPDWDWDVIHGSFGKSNFTTLPESSPVVDDKMDVTAIILDDPNLVTEKFNNDRLQSLYLDTTNMKGVSQFDVVNACISYIKYPNRVFIGGYDHIDKHSDNTTLQIQCDIDEAFHQDIVDIAVKLASANIMGGINTEQK
jgi:hypothetical protein